MTKLITIVVGLFGVGLLASDSFALAGATRTTNSAATSEHAAPQGALEVSTPLEVRLAPEVVVIGADSEERSRLGEALARFRENGLALPDLEVRFYDDLAECRGHYGLFQRSFTPWRVLICSDYQFVPTHELAHAWEAANITDEDRHRYLKARGLSTWADSTVEWMDRGAEDMAFIIQQNLTATNPALASATWVERTGAYELATGRPSPLLQSG